LLGQADGLAFELGVDVAVFKAVWKVAPEKS
jgi:hypothetical protein